MTEPRDPVSRRYRELAREEPPASLDAAILSAARDRAPVAREAPRGASGVRPRFSNWMGPVSIAAVLVLGIGVSLRMQLEQPGIETSAPSPARSEISSPTPAAPEPAPETARDIAAPAKQASNEQGRAKEDLMARAAPKPQALRRDATQTAAGAGARSEAQATAPSEPNPFADAPVVMQQAPSGAATPAAALGAAPLEEKTRAKVSADRARAPAAATDAVATAPAAVAPAPPPAASVPAPAAAPQASAMAPAPAMPAARPASPAVAGAVAPQPKREADSANIAERELKKSLAAGEAAADPDPARELERIAKLREAGAQREADRALEAFRRRHPDFRIPEAMWERVKPR